MGPEDLKVLLETPIALLMLMLAASVVSGLKQLKAARQRGGTMSLGAYLMYWPEIIMTAVGNGIAFAVLILTDQLNFASALGIGYGINSVVEVLRPAGRAASMASSFPTGPSLPGS